MKSIIFKVVSIAAIIIGVCVLASLILLFTADELDYMRIGEVRKNLLLSFDMPESKLNNLCLRTRNPGFGDDVSILCTGAVQVVCQNEYEEIQFGAMELRRVHFPAFSPDYVEYSLSFTLNGKDLTSVRKCLLVGRSCKMRIIYYEMPNIDATMWLRYHESYMVFLLKRLKGIGVSFFCK